MLGRMLASAFALTGVAYAQTEVAADEAAAGRFKEDAGGAVCGWDVADESAGRAARASFDVLGNRVEAEFDPHEIKTFVLRDGEVRETNLLEW
mgnify:CR=1 FL=1